MLLYYTGITRLAKSILGEIVQGMFLNDHRVLSTLSKIGQHAIETYEILQSGDYLDLAGAVDRSWQLNQRLDRGTNPEKVQEIISKIQEQVLGLKLLGAGGGGYMLIMAKDSMSAAKIIEILTESPPNGRARFIDFDISNKGLQVTRS